MPRYFFDTYDGDRLLRDEAGADYETFDDAKEEARARLPDMARDTLPNGTHRSFVVSVRNEAGTVVVRMSLSLVVEEGDVDH